MSSLTISVPRVKSDRKPVLPVNLAAYFVVGANRQDAIGNAAVLRIIDTATSEEMAYCCAALFDGERCLDFCLTTFGTGEIYDQPATCFLRPQANTLAAASHCFSPAGVAHRGPRVVTTQPAGGSARLRPLQRYRP